MSWDAFGRFDDAKDEDEWKAVGRDLRDTVFTKLGSHHPLDVFKMFRGRVPTTGALLKGLGLE
jgi:oligopeptidase A